jgi:DNA-binding response OmpR family regulator
MREKARLCLKSWRFFMQAMVVADDPDEKDVLIFVLRREGLAVASSTDPQRVLKNWTDHPADLLVVAMTEEADPLSLAEAVRTTTQTPLLMLVEPLSEKALCALLHTGADVVLTRPVSPQLLAAHVHGLIRRSSAVPNFVLPSLALDEIALDPSTRTVEVEGEEPRRLTHLEFRLLYTLMTHRGQVIPTDVIVERVWGYTGEGNQDLVRGLVSRLRRKIEPDRETPRFVETIPGVGYRFVVDTA